MSNRLDTKLSELRAKNEKALVAFLTAGDPDYDTSAMSCNAIFEGGADIIELGMPFSDPMADGPAIQEANIRALQGGQTIARTLQIASDLRDSYPEKPVVLMGYANPVHFYGYENFVIAARKAGVDGLIIVDLPPEENEELYNLCRAHNLHLISLVTPTTDAARLSLILKRSSGFIYYVAVAGITGTTTAQSADLQTALAQIKAATDLPVMTGFGIKTPEDAKAAAQYCDGVVVGSALIKALHENGVNSMLKLIQSIKQAI